ncbi:hypothetical protein ACB098_08G009600 [Castanea mollissima]
MARKQRPSHLDDPPAVSSSTEEEEVETFSDDEDEDEQEEEGGGGQEEVEEEEGEQSSSEEEEEEEEEEEAEAAKIESLPSTPPVKPHHPSSSGPMEPESTPVKATQARSTRSSTIKNKKRPNSETETTLSKSKSKRVKKKDADPEPKSQGGGGEEKKLFQRLWSDDNEIELLKGMLDYRAIHDSDPATDAAAFYEFVKESLHVEVTKAQLVDKMRRLRKKYRNNAGRAKKGKEPPFSKLHDRKTYELSNKIWGCADGVSVSVSVSGRCLNGMLSFNKDVMVLDETLIKRGLELIGEQKRLELEERWKRVELAELQMYVTRAELIRDQASWILEAYKGH